MEAFGKASGGAFEKGLLIFGTCFGRGFGEVFGKLFGRDFPKSFSKLAHMGVWDRNIISSGTRARLDPVGAGCPEEMDYNQKLGFLRSRITTHKE